MDKENEVCMYTVEYHEAIKEKKILPFAATCIDPEGIMLSEISHTEKDTYPKISLLEGM